MSLCRPGGPSLHCVRLLSLSPRYVHIRTCCRTCGASPELKKALELGVGLVLEYQPEAALKEACRIPCYHDDAPPMQQHAQKCTEQRLRARSPMQWSGGLTCWWCGNTRLSDTATPHHPPSQLQATTRPHHLIGSPSNLARISSMGHTTDP